MKIELPHRTVDVFTISPRTLMEDRYWTEITQVVRWSEDLGASGVLLFTGNDTYVDPWVAAHFVLAETKRLVPLVAVNPVFMHPFSAAKMISSFAYLYRKPVMLNLVTGTALSYLEALGDRVSHDERYERLCEYGQTIRMLLSGEGRVTFAGRYYQLSNAELRPPVPPTLQPRYLVAGQSSAARTVRQTLRAVGLTMLRPDHEHTLGEATGIHFGLVTRPDEADAWRAARAFFPDDAVARRRQKLSLASTDSTWKRDLASAPAPENVEDSGYWLTPFQVAAADCPYLIGNYERVADTVTRLVELGAELLVLDIPARAEEFEHAARALNRARERLLAQSAGVPPSL